MTNKNFTRTIAILTIAIVILFFGLIKVTYGQENTTIVDTIKKHTSIDYPQNKVTVFVKNEWEDIKEYQRHSWHQSKQQLAKNKEQVKGYWETIADVLGRVFAPNETNTDTKNR